MYQRFFNHINRFVVLTSEDEKIVLKYVQFKNVKNKDFLLKAGTTCNANFFVVEGCFRMYMSTENGTDQILQFGISDWWITDYTSFERQQPSEFSIQALETSTVICLEKQNQEELLSKVPQMERYFRMIVQRAYTATLMRLHFIFNYSGEERYRRFLALYPEFVQRIPQYMLASYMGFTPEFLSKIRAKRD